jgi:hypothetical protein
MSRQAHSLLLTNLQQKPMQVGTRRTRTLKQCDLSWDHSLAAATQLT